MRSTRRTIKYIGFYAPRELDCENRVHSMAAMDKMDYICSALVRAGYDVHIVSPSWTRNESGYHRGRTLRVNEHVTVTVFPTFGAKSRVLRALQLLLGLLWFFVWMMGYVKRNERVIVYHSLWLAAPLSLSKRLRKFEMVLEVEEIYCKVMCYHPYWVRIENAIVDRADMYILPNDLMPKTVNARARPYVSVYGVYDVPDKLGVPAGDGKIHLVYAGIIDKYKAGAFRAVESAQYLGSDYIMHILGFGDTGLLKTTIDELAKPGACKVLFQGLKTGDEYVRFMQRCHIGLSTQTAGGDYVDFSFPSKILSYLSLGLRVVSADIRCVERSKIGDLVTYYSSDDPAAIAEAIKSIDMKSAFNPEDRLEELDRQFVKDIKGLIERIPDEGLCR